MTHTFASLASAAGLLAALVPQDWSQRSRFSVRDESTSTRTLQFAGAGDRTLEVRAIHGSIRVLGRNRSDVMLQVRKTIRAATDADQRAAERDVVLDIVDNTPRVEAVVIEPEGSSCAQTSYSRRSIWDPAYVVTFDFTIEVPRDTRLRLCTINGGEILVEQTRGDFDIRGVNGRISLQNVAGSGIARTVNGSVTASFAEQPGAASEFVTTNGQVVVTLPPDLSADLRLKTFNGGLFTDFAVQTLPQPAAVPERRNGKFVYRSNQFTVVRAGRGGPELTLETFNGDVRLLQGAR